MIPVHDLFESHLNVTDLQRSRAEVQQLVAEFVSSGMRRSEFCQSRGLSFSTVFGLKSRAGVCVVMLIEAHARAWKRLYINRQPNP